MSYTWTFPEYLEEIRYYMEVKEETTSKYNYD
jgi:hypothetical protein